MGAAATRGRPRANYCLLITIIQNDVHMHIALSGLVNDFFARDHSVTHTVAENGAGDVIGAPMHGHEGYITCIAFSADGEEWCPGLPMQL